MHGTSGMNGGNGMNRADGSGDDAPSLQTGLEVIRRFVGNLPRRPGVYRMYDAGGNLLYVGKARDLKARVGTYARGQAHSARLTMMLSHVARMEYTTTASESEALLLEANLIRKLKPRYNILLRDDKSFPYILIDKSHAAARLTKHRGARRARGSYYGPFANAGAVNRALDALQKAFLVRTCTDSVYANRSRPCLLHQIRRCAAPCTGEVSIGEYEALVRQAEDFLSGRSRKVQAQLTRAMEEAAERLDYESAAVLRDRLAAMAHIAAGQGIEPRTFEAADLFAISQQGGHACIQVFFFRNYQNWGNRAYFPRTGGKRPPPEVLSAFIAQFYTTRPAPPLILLSHPLPDAGLLSEALGDDNGHKVTIHAPQRGEKRALVEMALDNAREALGQKLASRMAQEKLLEQVGELFSMPRPPRRVEVYDNSHIQGANAIGARIVAGPEGFMKAHYRKFNIRGGDIAPGDDFAMMREVMRRRFRQLSRKPPGEAGNGGDGGEDIGDGDFPRWPDLVLIDGGRGQLNAALEALRDVDIKGITFVGVAKGPRRDAGEETFHMADGGILRLRHDDPVLYYLQRLRDEAHRFAIGTHRARRAGEARRNPLDAIPGVGPARKKALLAAFGSARAVAKASPRELAAVEGISLKLAHAIHDYFR